MFAGNEIPAEDTTDSAPRQISKMRLPLDYDRQERDLVFVWADRADVAQRLRLSALDFPVARLRAIPASDFLSQHIEFEGNSARFLFHMPFSGSTLLAACLEELGLIVLRDPAILDALYQDARTDHDDDLARLGEAILIRFGDLGGKKAIVIRTAGYHPTMVRRLSLTPAFNSGIFLYCDWRDFVCQVLKDPKRCRDMRLLAEQRGSNFAVTTRPEANAAAWFWLEHLRCSASLAASGAPIRTVHSEDFFADPIGMAARIAKRLDAARSKVVTQSGNWGQIRARHAKTGQAFDESNRIESWHAARVQFSDLLSKLEKPMAEAGIEEAILTLDRVRLR